MRHTNSDRHVFYLSESAFSAPFWADLSEGHAGQELSAGFTGTFIRQNAVGGICRAWLFR